jgi:hypothetical protein
MLIYVENNINVAHLLKEETVELRKHPLLGNGCVTSNNELLEAVFSVRSVPRLYKEDQLSLRVLRRQLEE